jgi:hypothetical protein
MLALPTQQTTQTRDNMNTAFFKTRLRDRQITQRKLASHLGLDPAAVTLLLRGERRMRPEEAQTIADLLKLPITEVLREAGMQIREGVQKVPVQGSVDSHGRVTLMPVGTHEMTTAPEDVPRDGYAFQMRAFGDVQDGWVIFVSDATASAEQHLDRLCAVSVADGRAVVAFVKRGYRQGLYNLALWPSREPMHDVAIASVSPVLWLRPYR